MSDVYLKAKSKFSAKYSHRVSTAMGDSSHESEPHDDSDESPCTKRVRPSLPEDLQEPLESFLFNCPKEIESDGIAKDTDRECGSLSTSTDAGWIDDFLIGEALCTSTNPIQTSPHMNCLPGRFHSVTLTANDLRPGLFQDLYNNHAMF